MLKNIFYCLLMYLLGLGAIGLTAKWFIPDFSIGSLYVDVTVFLVGIGAAYVFMSKAAELLDDLVFEISYNINRK